MKLVTKTRILTVLLSLAALAPAARAQDNSGPSAFDYLLGDWEFTAQSREFGKFDGRWSAVRLDTGQILDEYRVLGDGGKTIYATTTIRAYNAPAGRWELIGMDRSGGLQDFGTGRREGSEMHIEQRFRVAEGKQITMRIRYYNIEANRFSWSADRSTDGGKTWVKDFQTIEARRIGPARHLDPLTAHRTAKEMTDAGNRAR